MPDSGLAVKRPRPPRARPQRRPAACAPGRSPPFLDSARESADPALRMFGDPARPRRRRIRPEDRARAVRNRRRKTARPRFARTAGGLGPRPTGPAPERGHFGGPVASIKPIMRPCARGRRTRTGRGRGDVQRGARSKTRISERDLLDAEDAKRILRRVRSTRRQTKMRLVTWCRMAGKSRQILTKTGHALENPVGHLQNMSSAVQVPGSKPPHYGDWRTTGKFC